MHCGRKLRSFFYIIAQIGRQIACTKNQETPRKIGRVGISVRRTQSKAPHFFSFSSAPKVITVIFCLGQYINIHPLLTISIQNMFFCCENIGADHTLQDQILITKFSQNYLNRKYGYYLGEFSNSSSVINFWGWKG